MAERRRQGRASDLARIEAQYPGAAATPSGLRYLIRKEGKGPKPTAGQTVRLAYRGTLLSGETFDSSDLHGPLEFAAGQGRVLPGLDEAALDMRRGEKRLLVVPPELGFGEQPAGAIPGNSFLVFELELLQIK